MVRLADLPADIADGYRKQVMPEFPGSPWTASPPLMDARIAIVTTAGLHRRGDAKFAGGSSDYRLIPGDVDPADLLMSHVSVNFDRSGFQQDLNVVLPLEHLRSLHEAGQIGSIADWHYSFMGATDPTRMQEAATHVARLLHGDGVTNVILVPV